MEFTRSALITAFIWTVLCGIFLVSAPKYAGLTLLVWMIGLPIILFFGKLKFETRATQRSEIDSMLSAHGFTKGSGQYIGPGFGFASENWGGTYKGRTFWIGMLVVRGSSFHIGYPPLRFETHNKTGKDIYIELGKPDKMKENGLEDIYQRLEKIRLSAENPNIGLGKMTPDYINKYKLSYTLSSYLVNEQNIKELLDAVCDAMDRLGI